MRVTCNYTWDLVEANHRAYMYMHDSMHKLQLEIREPQEEAHKIMTPYEFQTHVAWPEVKPFYPGDN